MFTRPEAPRPIKRQAFEPTAEQSSSPPSDRGRRAAGLGAALLLVAVPHTSMAGRHVFFENKDVRHRKCRLGWHRYFRTLAPRLHFLVCPRTPGGRDGHVRVLTADLAWGDSASVSVRDPLQ